MFDLEKAKASGNFRELKHTAVSGKFIEFEGRRLLNLASNDYLGIASDRALRNEFLEQTKNSDFFLGSGSSRLIYTAGDIYDKLESHFESIFNGKSALIFNSGYAANLGVIASFAGEKTLFLADKLIHASMIDALVISKANYKRFAHNDTSALSNMLAKYASDFENVIILTEAMFSMDGDLADIRKLVELKKQYKNIKLYIDEAHSFFSIFESGLCKHLGLDKDVDFILITLSKALGGNGAVFLGNTNTRDILVNSARSLIFSTAISSIQIAWTEFVLQKDFSERRKNLEENIRFLGLSQTQIGPFIVGESDDTLALSEKLRNEGFFVPAIRPPTVPLHTSRLRISLRGDLTVNDIEKLKQVLNEYHAR